MFTLEGITGGKAYLLSALQADKRWLAMPTKPAGMAADICKAVAETIATTQVAGAIRSILERAYTSYVMSNGERPGLAGLEQDEWESALDDVVAGELEPFTPVMSSSFFGEITVDTQLHKEGEIDRLATKAGKEVWKILTWEKTTNKVLSACGIVLADIEALPGVIPGMASASIDDIEDAETVDNGAKPMSNSILNKIILFTMGTPDPDAWQMVIDTDDILAAGGGQRLGLDVDETRALRAAYRMDPNQLATWQAKVAAAKYLPEMDDVQVVDGVRQPPDMPAQLVREAIPTVTAAPSVPAAVPAPSLSAPSVQPAPAVPAPTAAPAIPAVPALTATPTVPSLSSPVGVPSVPSLSIDSGPGLQTPVAPAMGATPAISRETLESLKDNGGFKDQELADACGVSRPTVNNYIKGKATFAPSPDQRAKLIAMARQRAEAMVNVLSELSGNSYAITAGR